jgi:hypothetical protein
MVERLKILKNTEQGACFMVGNGYTLRPEDLDLIAGRPSFAMNAISVMFERTIWRPTYYVCVTTAMKDFTYQDYLKNAIEASRLSFLWYWYMKELNINYDNIVQIKCVHLNDTKPENPWVDDITKGVSKWGTSMNTACQLAVWLGFTELYFIGVPGSYMQPKAHFDNYPEHYGTWTQSDDMVQQETHHTIMRNLTRRGIKAFNCSRETFVTAYPRMTLEEALCRL